MSQISFGCLSSVVHSRLYTSDASLRRSKDAWPVVETISNLETRIETPSATSVGRIWKVLIVAHRHNIPLKRGSVDQHWSPANFRSRGRYRQPSVLLILTILNHFLFFESQTEMALSWGPPRMMWCDRSSSLGVGWMAAGKTWRMVACRSEGHSHRTRRVLKRKTCLRHVGTCHTWCTYQTLSNICSPRPWALNLELPCWPIKESSESKVYNQAKFGYYRIRTYQNILVVNNSQILQIVLVLSTL